MVLGVLLATCFGHSFGYGLMDELGAIRWRCGLCLEA